MAEFKSIDEINGFRLSDEASELVAYAMSLIHLGHELPIAWWRDHIVEDPDEKLIRYLSVAGPIISRAEVSIFDPYEKACVLLMDYTNAAYKSFEQVMVQADHLMRHVIRFGRVVKFSALRENDLLSRHGLRVLSTTGLVTTVRHSESSEIWIAFANRTRSWHYDMPSRSLRDSFRNWQDQVVERLNRAVIQDLVNHYLAVNDPERFGGGA